MHVEEGKRQDQAVLGPPTPRHLQRPRSCQERTVGVDRALRLSGRARGVDDQRIVGGPSPIQRDVVPADALEESTRCAQHRPGQIVRKPFPTLGPFDQAYRRIDVAGYVAQLAPAGRRVDGDDDCAETQRTEEADHRVERGRATPEHPVPRHDTASGQGDRGEGGLLCQCTGVQRTRPVPLDENRTVRFVTPTLCPHLGQRVAGRQIRRAEWRSAPWSVPGPARAAMSITAPTPCQ